MFEDNLLHRSIWLRLKTCSRRRLRNPKHYNPKGNLLVNLSKEFNISLEDAYLALCQMHNELTKKKM